MLKNLKQIIFWLTFACLLTPFLVSSRTYFPFIVTKAIVFRVLVEVMALLWVLMIVKGEIKIKLNGLSKVLLLYALAICLSAFFGVNFYWSFFSGFERMEGVFGLWHFILFFLIISSVFDLEDLKKLLKAEVIISVFYGVLSLLIYIGYKIGPVANTPRLSGFTGNPSYLGTYFIFNAFLALYFYLENFQANYLVNTKLKFSFWKTLFSNFESTGWFLIAVFDAFLLFISGTRGGMIGFGFGFLFLGVNFLFHPLARPYLVLKKLFLFILIGGVLLVSFVFAFKNTALVQNNFALNRLSSISLKDPTGLARLLSAQTALKSFLEKPLFGWGIENYEPAYLKNFNPQVVKVLPGDFYFDRAHNKVMEVLATTGIFGFVFYLAIFFFAFYLLEKVKKQPGQFLAGVLLEALLLSYFVQNIFLFDFHESYLMFFLVLGFISVLGCHPRGNGDLSDSRLRGNDKMVRGNDSSLEAQKVNSDFAPILGKGLIVVLSFCVIIISLTQIVFKEYFISRQIISIIQLLVSQKNDEAYQLYRKTMFDAGPFINFKKDIIIGVENAFASYLQPTQELKPFVDKIIEDSDLVLKTEPWNYRLIMNKAQLLLNEASYNPSRFQEAEKEAQILNQVAPYFPQTHLFLAKIYFLENKLDQAKAEIDEVLRLNPSDPTALYLLSIYYSNLKDASLTDEYLIKAWQAGYPFRERNSLLKLANLFAQKADYLTVAKIYLYAIQLNPQDSEMYVHLAATYAQLKDKNKAIEYARKAVELNPNLQQAAQQFIDSLEKNK